MKQPFTKVEGLGNDFVLFDLTEGGKAPLDPARVIALCDRHLGVGADGVLVLSPSDKGAALFRIWNSDGSQSEMCGNGLRCAALHLFKRLGQRELTLQTAAGLHRVRPAGAGMVWVELVGLKVGRPERLKLMEAVIPGRRVSLGNPHFVVHDRSLAEAPQLGPTIENDEHFAPARTNVEFCEADGSKLRVRVWERGAELTQACGTGAAAAAAAAWEDGIVPRAVTTVELPGGSLQVEPLAADRVALLGPAREVFEGELEL